MTVTDTPLEKSNNSILLLFAAILANGVAGLLYVWSLFILPIESALGLNRADLGVISSLTLISFTVGVSIMPPILARTGRLPVAILAFVLMGGGHLAFGLWQSKSALMVGYGLGFGAGSGMAYGFALSLVASLPDRFRARAIGLALGAFALSGILLPFFLGDWIAATDPAFAFLQIGWVALGVGCLCALLLLAAGAVRMSAAQEAAKKTSQFSDRPFLILSAIFFLICFSGLAVVSQAAAIASDAGIAPAGYAATALTVGYLAGSLLGAPLAERTGERPVLLGLSILVLIAVLAILTGSAIVFFLGNALVGISFGGIGSIMPVLLGLRYGPTNIASLYGRMIIAYGLAGLIAPAIAGLFYDITQNYTSILFICAVFSLIALVFSLRLDKHLKLR